MPVKPVMQFTFTVSPSLYEAFAAGSVFSYVMSSRRHSEKHKQTLHKDITVMLNAEVHAQLVNTQKLQFGKYI